MNVIEILRQRQRDTSGCRLHQCRAEYWTRSVAKAAL